MPGSIATVTGSLQYTVNIIQYYITTVHYVAVYILFCFQGFCCECHSFNKGYNVRGDFSCSGGFIGVAIKKYRWGSAHCMQHHDLWLVIYAL